MLDRDRETKRELPSGRSLLICPRHSRSWRRQWKGAEISVWHSQAGGSWNWRVGHHLLLFWLGFHRKGTTELRVDAKGSDTDCTHLQRGSDSIQGLGSVNEEPTHDAGISYGRALYSGWCVSDPALANALEKQWEIVHIVGPWPKPLASA